MVNEELLVPGNHVAYASPCGGSGAWNRGEGTITVVGKRWVRLTLTTEPVGSTQQVSKRWLHRAEAAKALGNV